jgi:HSP20 family protein
MVVRIRQFPLLRSFPAFGLPGEFDAFLGDLLGNNLERRTTNHPPIDVEEYEDQSVVAMEIPGVKKEDVTVSIQDGSMTISGQRNSIQLPEDAKVVWNERNDGEFVRTIPLPHDVSLEQVSADLVDGILRIQLPKAETARPRKIEVK